MVTELVKQQEQVLSSGLAKPDDREKDKKHSKKEKMKRVQKMTSTSHLPPYLQQTTILWDVLVGPVNVYLILPSLMFHDSPHPMGGAASFHSHNISLLASTGQKAS